jgi:hypothetical protein
MSYKPKTKIKKEKSTLEFISYVAVLYTTDFYFKVYNIFTASNIKKSVSDLATYFGVHVV